MVGMRYHVERRRGVAAYQQIVDQTKRAIRSGELGVGDRLPTAREVAESCAVNPNTTLKAYRELEREGVVELRQGVGTFVCWAPARMGPGQDSPLYSELADWIGRALLADLDHDDIRGLVELALEKQCGLVEKPRLIGTEETGR
ncbi:GntR family transcriptional regulator (plasmid) [Streptomyces tendae]|uniref:GntR family transcriptional regulator n=2 Tax=Streptomyces tendae TaxID=1932 RepID=A0ABX6A1T9_STRTE|nr:GntR family transcriptional regulator [Streptomyces tendae]